MQFSEQDDFFIADPVRMIDPHVHHDICIDGKTAGVGRGDLSSVESPSVFIQQWPTNAHLGVFQGLLDPDHVMVVV